jgi:hypothetical protein
MEMAEVINKTVAVDVETGEIYYQRSWAGFNGWTEKGYKYRNKYYPVQFYPDTIPKLLPNTLKIFFYICMLMNEDNLLLERKAAKDKYSSPKIIPYTVEEIWEKLDYRFSMYSFKKAWQELTPKYVRKIKIYGKGIWAVNPAFANRTKYLPVFLWKEFSVDINNKLSKQVISRFQNLALVDDMIE